MKELFFIFLFFIFYLYIGYMWVIIFLGKVFRYKHTISDNYEPNITIMVPTKNEEFTIEQKIKNIISLDYPREKVQILIIDSSSDDQTQKIVENFKKQWVELVIVPHKGKAYAMQEWINNHATWEIIISTDANAYFKKDVVCQVVKHFSDISVAWVSWAMMQVDESSTIESEWSWIYWKIEKILRIYESQYHSCICMNGEITCVRKSVVQNKQWYYRWDADDFDLSLFIIKNGYRIIYEPNAVVWEKAPDVAGDIEKQKVRIIVQTFSAFTHYFSVLFTKRYGFILFSHKFLAIFSPLFFIWAFISNMSLLGEGIFYILVFSLQCLFYTMFALRINWSIFRVSNFLIFLNYLILKSYIVFLMGADFTKWDKIMSSRK